MQLTLFNTIDRSTLTEEIFAAYFDCRKNKRNTKDALLFEKHFEVNLFLLIDEICLGNYQPDPSTVFIVKQPVLREIFAATFRDRIMHHWLINKLNPLFETLFIDNSFACRKNKGTHLAIKKVDEAIKSVSENYTKDCYILKLDIKGFFMHINKELLHNRLITFVKEKYDQTDRELVLSIIDIIISNDPTKNCIVKGKKSDWYGLPDDKSLFNSPPNCGLPIGNLTSQIFANFYLHIFDSWMNIHCGILQYFRYVDDFIVIHTDKLFLTSMIKDIAHFLHTSLSLTLHPCKIYLQHYSKGVQFLGTIIKPGRMYIGNRTKGNIFKAITSINTSVTLSHITMDILKKYICILNSYMGHLLHCNTYRFRKNLIQNVLSNRLKLFVACNNESTSFYPLQ
jgi:retron-type reverse transcriptase